MTRGEILRCNDIGILKEALSSAWSRVDALEGAAQQVESVKEQLAKPNLKRAGLPTADEMRSAQNPIQDSDFRKMSQAAKQERANQSKDGLFSLFARIDKDGDQSQLTVTPPLPAFPPFPVATASSSFPSFFSPVSPGLKLVLLFQAAAALTPRSCTRHCRPTLGCGIALQRRWG